MATIGPRVKNKATTTSTTNPVMAPFLVDPSKRELLSLTERTDKPLSIRLSQNGPQKLRFW